jgi:hypothetical protein
MINTQLVFFRVQFRLKDSTFNNYGEEKNIFSAIVSDDDDDEGDKTTGQADGQDVPALSDDEELTYCKAIIFYQVLQMFLFSHNSCFFCRLYDVQ